MPMTEEERKHKNRIKSATYYNAHKDKVLSRHKVYRANETKTKPWISHFNNARAKAKMKGYMGEVDVMKCRSLYQRAVELGKRVEMILHPDAGGKFEYTNLHLVDKEVPNVTDPTGQG